MFAIVLKRGFVVGGQEVAAGSLIDTEGLRNAEVALRTRHLRPASASEIAEYEKKTKKK